MTNFALVEPLIDLLDSEILKWKENQVFPKYLVCNPLNLDIIVAMYKGIHVISDNRNTHLEFLFLDANYIDLNGNNINF